MKKLKVKDFFSYKTRVAETTTWLDNLFGFCNARIEAYDFKFDVEKYKQYKEQHKEFFAQF